MARLVHSRHGGLLAFALILVVLPFALPNAYYLTVAINIGLAAIVCVGLNLLIGYAGQISLGHAGFYGLGAYGSAILVTNHRWPALLAMAATMASVGVFAYLIARPILRLRGHYLAMATLALGIIIAILLGQEVHLTGGPDGMPVDGFEIFGWRVRGEWQWYWLVAGSLFAVAWLALNLIDSPLGRALRALHGSEVAAQVTGIDTARLKVTVFVASAVIASYAGCLYGHFVGWLTPDEASFIRSVYYVAMVVLGGMASVFGAICGAAILTALPQLLTVFHDYEHVVLGAVMMGTMIFMPRGLVPTIRRAWRGRSA